MTPEEFAKIKARHPSEGHACPQCDEYCCCGAYHAPEKCERGPCDTAMALAEVERLRGVLGFYADPGTYWAMAYAFDPPTGGFDDDLEDLSEMGPEYGHRFGKRARAALGVAGVEAEGLAALEAGDG
jgi:hypothetical protein